MSQPLISELAARLNVDEAQAATLLRGFVEQLRAAVDAGGEAIIPEVGRFEKSGDRLSFEPDPALSTAVNFRYAGLEPIEIEAQELPSAFEAPVGAVSQPVEGDEPPVDADDWLETAGMEAEAGHPEEDISWDEDSDDAHHLSAGAVAPEWGEAPEEPGDLPEVEAEPVGDVDEEIDPRPEPRSIVEEDERPAANVVDLRPAPAPSRRATRIEHQPEKERKQPAPWIIATIVVVMAGLAAFFLLRPDNNPDEVTIVFNTPPAAERAAVQEDEPSPGAATNALDGTETDAPAMDASEPAPPEQTAPTQEPATPAESEDPLRGNEIDRSVSRYTLVVGSLQSSAVAEEVAATWRGRGFRTGVFSETANGVTRYRVGVGQFESIDAADAARSGEIASQLPEGTWVYRYPVLPSE